MLAEGGVTVSSASCPTDVQDSSQALEIGIMARLRVLIDLWR
jgi:hypothetical protein